MDKSFQLFLHFFIFNFIFRSIIGFLKRHSDKPSPLNVIMTFRKTISFCESSSVNIWRCAKLRASHVFMPYVPHVPLCAYLLSCLYFLRAFPFFAFLKCFHFLRALRACFLRTLHAFIILRALRAFIFLRALRAFTFLSISNFWRVLCTFTFL